MPQEQKLILEVLLSNLPHNVWYELTLFRKSEAYV